MTETATDVKYAPSHEWARKLEGDIVEVGISDFAQEALGDVVYVELPAIDDEVHAGEECCAVESVKAASDIYAPVSGVIVAINPQLEDEPELLNGSPFGDGWMFKIKASDIEELDNLLSAADYAAKQAES